MLFMHEVYNLQIHFTMQKMFVLQYFCTVTINKDVLYKVVSRFIQILTLHFQFRLCSSRLTSQFLLLMNLVVSCFLFLFLRDQCEAGIVMYVFVWAFCVQFLYERDCRRFSSVEPGQFDRTLVKFMYQLHQSE